MKTLTIEDVAFSAPASTRASAVPSPAARWGGRILAGLPLLFMTVDAAMKLAAVPQVLEASAKLGFVPSSVTVIGVAELVAVVLTLFQRTRVFGSVLLSAYLGGAVCVHVQHHDPLFSHTLFPIYFAVMIWGGLALLDARVRALSPFAGRA